MYARVITGRLKLATLDRGLTILEGQVRPHVAARPGFQRWELLVERETAPPPGDATDEDFLRRVLRTAVGPEVDAPFAALEADLDAQGPRRVMCDEVGAALLRECPVTLRGVLHVAATAHRDDVLAGALERVRALFRDGRDESAAAAAAERVLPRDLEGPWPPPRPMPRGWTPGETVRVTEIVQRLSDDPEVYGVEALEARAGTGAWSPYDVAVDPGCVPVLPPAQCLRVQLDLVEGCGGAC